MQNKELVNAIRLLQSILINAKFEINSIEPVYIANGEVIRIVEAFAASAPSLHTMWSVPESQNYDRMKFLADSFVNKVTRINCDEVGPRASKGDGAIKVKLDDIFDPLDLSSLSLDKKINLEAWVEYFYRDGCDCDFVELIRQLDTSFSVDILLAKRIVISATSNFLFSNEKFVSVALCFNPLLDDLILWASKQLVELGVMDSVNSLNSSVLALNLREKFNDHASSLLAIRASSNGKELLRSQAFPFELDSALFDDLLQFIDELQAEQME